MSAKHTPGPWKAHDYGGGMYRWVVTVPAGPEDRREQVAEVDSSDECEANAALMAAAPDLVDMLDEALAALGDHAVTDVHRDIVVRGWALIAKARGGA